MPLQNAIDAACDGTPYGMTIGNGAPPPILLPTGVWLHSQPLRLFCALNFGGYTRGNGGMNSNMITRLTQNYWGTVAINEGLGSDNLVYIHPLRSCSGTYCGAMINLPTGALRTICLSLNFSSVVCGCGGHLIIQACEL